MKTSTNLRLLSAALFASCASLLLSSCSKEDDIMPSARMSQSVSDKSTIAGTAVERNISGLATDHKSKRSLDTGAQEISNGLENQGTSAGQAQQRTAGSLATDHKSGRTFDNGAQEISNGLENQGTSAGQAQQRTAGSLATDHKSGRSFDNGAQEFTPLHSASTQAQEQK